MLYTLHFNVCNRYVPEMRNINNIIDDKILINDMFSINRCLHCLQAGLSSLKYKKKD